MWKRWLEELGTTADGQVWRLPATDWNTSVINNAYGVAVEQDRSRNALIGRETVDTDAPTVPGTMSVAPGLK